MRRSDVFLLGLLYILAQAASLKILPIQRSQPSRAFKAVSNQVILFHADINLLVISILLLKSVVCNSSQSIVEQREQQRQHLLPRQMQMNLHLSLACMP